MASFYGSYELAQGLTCRTVGTRCKAQATFNLSRYWSLNTETPNLNSRILSVTENKNLKEDPLTSPLPALP